MSSLYELALTVPWCITPEALEAMLSIAAREPLPQDEIARRMHGPNALARSTRTRREDSARMVMREGVALIPIDGPIYRYADFFTAVSGGVTTESLATDLQKALEDPAVSAILFAIDSPGGEATGINELSDAIYAARGRKPMVAYIEGYGASAAYWIASAADQVIVDDNALVGSIGTVMGVPDPAKRISRTIDFVSTQSPKKRADPTTDAGRAYLQSLVDDMTEVFIGKVMRNRGISREQVLAVEGGMLVGQKAVAAGLADRLGAEEDTIRELAAGTSLARRIWPGLPITLPARAPATQQEERMDWKAFWNGMFGAAAEAEGQPLAAVLSTAEPLQVTTAAAVDTSEQGAENAELRRQIAELQKRQIATDAAAFADTLITAEHKALPAERAELIAVYTQAAQDDAERPLSSGSRVELLRTAMQARPTRDLTKELVRDEKLLALAGGTTQEDADIATAREQAAAYAKRANGNGKK